MQASASGHLPLAGRPPVLVSEAETQAWASRLALAARPGDIIALFGDLGAGKTVFARAFVRARTRPDEEVPSPTFTLVQTYGGEKPGEPEIWHFDLFRLERAEDALELGVDDAFAAAISLIEWPQRLGPLLPPRSLGVALLPGDTADSRVLHLCADADWQQRLREAGLA